MLKILSLAAVVAVLPVVNDHRKYALADPDPEINTSFLLKIKHTPATGILQPEKRTAEPWSQNWLADAKESIRKSEYHFKWEEKSNAYCTPNRKNNLRFFYTAKGFSVQPRTTNVPVGDHDPALFPGEIKYRHIPNWKVKFSLDKKQVRNGKWRIVNNIAEYITDNITVQYINDEAGMRQNFIVQSPLHETGTLKINFNISTKLTTILTNDRLQFFHKRTNVLNYDQLQVWDATGRTLKSSFKKRKGNKYYIQVDTKDAVFPITIDPISTTPAALLESNQAGAGMGFSVAGAGDVNGDGYSDVIAGTPGYDNSPTDEGAAFIFHGSATGVLTAPAAVVESNMSAARMGGSVSTAGDVNGDGYSDIIVGAANYSNGETWEGAFYVYHGSPSGINTTAAIMIESNQAQAQMGFSVACAGDVNADGFSDVIVGAWLFDNPEVNEGAAFVYHGSATGISSTIATTLDANQSASNFGIAVAGAGDVNGDGYSDVIVGAEDYDSGQTDEGVVFIYHGSAAGINNVAVTMAESDQGFSQFGFSVATAGDVNGDGYSDVIVGAYTFDNVEINEGVAFVYHGSGSGVSSTAAAILEPNLVNVQFGVSVACAGDINGDGYSDVIVGAQTYDNVQTDEGAAYVYFGSGTGINTVAAAVLESNQANAQMGRGVAGAGDVNGDGYSDVIAGASQYDNAESNEGSAFVYHGSAAGMNTTATAMVEINQANTRMGYSVSSAGDVNADGYIDVIVGAFMYDNGQANEGAAFIYHGSATGIGTTAAAIIEGNQADAAMGFTVALAGDVNGDGYSDVLVAAPGYSNGQAYEGAAFVYHGSVSGINISAAAVAESNQASANMGFVASAGDVNGDGYSDVLVGASFYDNGENNEGVAFVFHGSATGISSTAAVMVESNQADAAMGFSVASAGDLNGDGFGDIAVGAYAYDNGQTGEGAAFVYHGSATGISTTPVVTLECDQVNAYMGIDVATAGDVNGDGYSDLIVGACVYDGKGAAFIYHGSATGVSTTVSTSILGSQNNSEMGHSVASAGDLNGDGYSDVIVGAFNFSNGEFVEGAIFLYHGSVTGINPSIVAMVESNQASAGFGISVNPAGDVNCDGYSDVIVGAHVYDNGHSDEGAAFVYMGNSPGSNRRNNLRLYNTDLITPISSNNFLLANFGAGFYAKSFLGRGKGKLVWETRLNYNAYSGTPITNSTFFTSQQASYSDLGLTGTELKDLISKINGGKYTKLRARIKYDPVTALTGQVYSPWRNVSSIIDANNLGVLPIDLVAFKAAWLQKGRSARVDFTTDKELGICCFDIERSVDGINFYPIGTVAAKNTAGNQQYHFIDNNATGKKLFYRLKIKGMAGQAEYSNIQQLDHNGNAEILVFPNPTADILQLQLNNSYTGMQVQVTNAAGQVLKMIKDLRVSPGQTISIPVQDLPPGKYWLHLHTGTQKQLLQFIKQ
jgi:FG-GAP-like repeat/Secretion system C-terminal sorting domain/FG-GAP repeat